jgi:hypothetical protein
VPATAIKPAALLRLAVTDDTTLSSFGKTDGDDADGEGEHATEHEANAESGANDSGFSTYACGEYVCTACNIAAERVWREDGAFVCPDCKSW